MKIESSSHKVTQAEACGYQKIFRGLSFKYYRQRIIDIFIEIPKQYYLRKRPCPSYACMTKIKLQFFLRKNIHLHLYSIGDLDDFFWPYTTWYGLKAGNILSAVALLYAAPSLPVLLALSEEPAIMRELLTQIRYLLPSRFYAHLSPGLETVFKDTPICNTC
jgi:hypothetical protein